MLDIKKMMEKLGQEAHTEKDRCLHSILQEIINAIGTEELHEPLGVTEKPARESGPQPEEAGHAAKARKR